MIVDDGNDDTRTSLSASDSSYYCVEDVDRVGRGSNFLEPTRPTV